jgi:hypothetical protein
VGQRNGREFGVGCEREKKSRPWSEDVEERKGEKIPDPERYIAFFVLYVLRAPLARIQVWAKKIADVPGCTVSEVVSTKFTPPTAVESDVRLQVASPPPLPDVGIEPSARLSMDTLLIDRRVWCGRCRGDLYDIRPKGLKRA